MCIARELCEGTKVLIRRGGKATFQKACTHHSKGGTKGAGDMSDLNLEDYRIIELKSPRLKKPSKRIQSSQIAGSNAQWQKQLHPQWV